MSNVMILGAGVMQVPLIRKVKEMGHKAVVVGSAGPYPGIPLADQLYLQDFTDSLEVLRIAREEHIDGICTSGVDLPVRTLAVVSESLGLPGIPSEAGKIVTDKLLMKECLIRHGVRTAPYIKATTLEDGYRAFDELVGPVIFKAVDSQGSRGIVKVETRDRVEYAHGCIRAATKLNHYIVEEFIEGREFGAQAFAVNGKLQFVLAHGDYVFYGDTGVPIGHFVPLEWGADFQRDCVRQLERCVDAAGLQTCAINADFILRGDSVYVLEIAARCGATMLAETVSIFYGIDYYEQIVRACLGQTTDFSLRPGGMPNATRTLFSETAGVITSILNDNPPDPDIVEIHFDQPVGARVNRFQLGIDRIGHVIVKGRSLDDVEKKLDLTLSRIQIRVDPV
jgi:biotin carboxylase